MIQAQAGTRIMHNERQFFFILIVKGKIFSMAEELIAMKDKKLVVSNYSY